MQYHPSHTTRRAMMASLLLSLLSLTPKGASAQAEAHALGRVQASAPVSLALSLPVRDPAGLADLLRRLYDPADPQFHQFLTPAQFADEFAPTAAQYLAVADAARAQGLTVTGTHADRLLLDVAGPDATVERAFGVRLTAYAAADGHIFRAPDATPSLPPALAGLVSGVIGLDTSNVQRPHLERLDARPATLPVPGSGPGGGLSPLDVKAAYGLDTVTLDGTGQSLAVFELDGYTPSDVRAYEDRFGLPRIPLDDILVDGVSGQPGSGANEVTLDLELIAALAPRARRVLVYEGPNSDQGIVDTYAKIADDDQAQEISTSWGAAEGDTTTVSLNGHGVAFVDAENTIFTQMAAQGQAVFAATGDNGAEDNGTTLSVDDPGSQPYVTSVGGTNLSTNATGGTYNTETVWNSLGSNSQYGAGGGGISAVHARPTYQQGLSTTSPVSTTQRNVPDVSLNADPQTGYATYFNGQWLIFGGTSTSAPLWAGFDALVNQQRARLGEASLGFFNPAIYAIGEGSHYAQDFHDVTSGNNDLTQNDPAHYAATAGYDLASGWGSFNGAHLLADLAGSTAAAAQPGPYTYPAGWNLLSLPYDDSIYSPSVLFGYPGASLYVWDPTNGLYIQSPTAPADAVRPGVGYWSYFTTPVTTQVNGTPPPATAPYPVPSLAAGWNQIGDPFPYPIALANTQFTNSGGTQLPFVGAEEAGWISGLLFRYDNATGLYAPVAEGTALQPGVGYWLYAFRPLSLRVPPP